MKQIMYVKGLPLHKQVTIIGIDPYLTDVAFNIPGNINLEHMGFLPEAGNQIVVLNEKPFQAGVPDVLISCLADADCVPEQLDNLSKIIEQCRSVKPGMQVINQPKNIMGTHRHEIYQRFSSLSGLIIPKTIRIAPKTQKDFQKHINDEFEGCVLIRETGQHSGQTLMKFDPQKDNANSLDKLAIDGRAFYVTEFKDTASEDGFYRKIRLFCIGGTYYMRHCIIGRDWNIHSRTRKDFMQNSKDLKMEEQEVLEKGLTNFSSEAQEALAILSDQMALEYFGIDGTLMPDGRLMIFEINAAMEAITQDTTDFPYLDSYISNIQNAFQTMLRNLLAQNQKALEQKAS